MNNCFSEAVNQAIGIWQKEIPIDFVEINFDQRSDITISFLRRAHGDSVDFDGNGIVLYIFQTTKYNLLL